METMIASFVLVVGLVGTIAVFGSAIKFTGLSRDQVVAAALAQEGIEIAKNIRDNNMLNGSFADGMTSGTYCVDYRDQALSSCSNNGQLYVNSDHWYVRSVTSQKTLFKRKIVVDSSQTDTLKIKSYVVWRDGVFPSSPTACTLRQKCVFAQTVLTNWK